MGSWSIPDTFCREIKLSFPCLLAKFLPVLFLVILVLSSFKLSMYLVQYFFTETQERASEQLSISVHWRGRGWNYIQCFQVESLMPFATSRRVVCVSIFQVLQPCERSVDLGAVRGDELRRGYHGQIQRWIKEACEWQTFGFAVHNCTMQNTLVPCVAQNLIYIMTNIGQEYRLFKDDLIKFKGLHWPHWSAVLLLDQTQNLIK